MGGEILREDGTVWREFDGGVHFTFGEISKEDFSVRERVYFIESEQGLLTLFEKQRDYSIYEGLPPPQYVTLSAKVWLFVQFFKSFHSYTGAV